MTSPNEQISLNLGVCTHCGAPVSMYVLMGKRYDKMKFLFCSEVCEQTYENLLPHWEGDIQQHH